MNYNKLLIENCNTVDYFNYLQEQKLQPELAVYKGKSLIIISYKSNTILEKIFQIFQNIKVGILQFAGALNTSKEKIQEVKNTVYQYHFETAKKYFPEQKINEQVLEPTQEPLETNNKSEKTPNKNRELVKLYAAKLRLELEIQNLQKEGK